MSADSWNPDERAARLHAEALVWDCHGCMPLRADDSYLPQLARYQKAGVDIVHINVGAADVPLDQQFRVLSYMRRWLQERHGDYVLIRRHADIRRAKSEGKLGVAFNIEGAAALGDQISLISSFYDLGVRWLALAYNRNNAVGGGCHDDDPGLSDFGRDLLDEMARVGMIACGSHTGYQTTLDAIEYSENPIILSHSNPRALHDHPRNVPDDVIKACAAKGGVIGINGVGLFLGGNDNLVDRLVRHVDYVVELIGSDHVGLGLDFCFDGHELDEILRNSSVGSFPRHQGYETGIRFVEPELMPEITNRLVKLGYSERRILGILGENFSRVAQQVWK